MRVWPAAHRGGARLGALLAVVLAACSSTPASQSSATGAPSGSELYGRYCARCHGDTGGGATFGTSLLDSRYDLPGYSNAEMAAAIRDGASSPGSAFGPMPGFPALGGDEVDAIVEQVRRLQETGPTG